MLREQGNIAWTAEQRAALCKELAPLATLQDVVRWGFRFSPPREVVAVVVQDEFSHDVVVTGPEGLYLAFDTT